MFTCKRAGNSEKELADEGPQRGPAGKVKSEAPELIKEDDDAQSALLASVKGVLVEEDYE